MIDYYYVPFASNESYKMNPEKRYLRYLNLLVYENYTNQSVIIITPVLYAQCMCSD